MNTQPFDMPWFRHALCAMRCLRFSTPRGPLFHISAISCAQHIGVFHWQCRAAYFYLLPPARHYASISRVYARATIPVRSRYVGRPLRRAASNATSSRRPSPIARHMRRQIGHFLRGISPVSRLAKGSHDAAQDVTRPACFLIASGEISCFDFRGVAAKSDTIRPGYRRAAGQWPPPAPARTKRALFRATIILAARRH